MNILYQQKAAEIGTVGQEVHGDQRRFRGSGEREHEASWCGRRGFGGLEGEMEADDWLWPP